MDINTTTAVQGASTPAAGSPATETPPSQGVSADFQTFLKMLTAQARYQDPLKPIDSTEYAAQLAQFSMVEQQVKTNDTLQQFVTRLGAANMAAMSGWIGQDVRAAGPAAFDGTPISLSYTPAAGAESAYLVVRDSSGREVQRMPVSPAGGTIEWTGVGENGAPVPPDTYSFEILSVSRGETIAQSQAAFYGRVAEVQTRDGETVLILDNGQEIPTTAVDAIRRPPEGSGA